MKRTHPSRVSGRTIAVPVIALAVAMAMQPASPQPVRATQLGDELVGLGATTPTGDELVGQRVTFNGVAWHVIGVDAEAGTATLLAADGLGYAHFDTASNAYASSAIRGLLDSLTQEGGSFAGVAGALKDVDLSDVDVRGAKLYLLDEHEANALPGNVRTAGFDWWLRSASNDGRLGRAQFVTGLSLRADADVSEAKAVRPAVQLDLAQLSYQSDSRTFVLAEEPHEEAGSDASAEDASQEQGDAAQEPAEPASIIEPPMVREGLVESGDAHELVSRGAVSGGELRYALGTDDATVPAEDAWSQEVPIGVEAGTYFVWYQAAGDEAHSDSEPAVATVHIEALEAQASGYHVASGDGAAWMKGSATPLEFSFAYDASSEEGGETPLLERLVSLSIDGTTLDAQDFERADDGATVRIGSPYLEALTAGDHELSASFENGSATARFMVVESTEPLPATAASTPETQATVSAPPSDPSSPAPDSPAPTMATDASGRFISKTDEVTYTITQAVPIDATYLEITSDLEPVLYFTTGQDEVSVTANGEGVVAARVTIDGQHLSVLIDDASAVEALRGQTISVSYKAKIDEAADLAAYLNDAKTTASIPYQARTTFRGLQERSVESASESIKVSVGNEATSTTAKSTMPYTGDPLLFVAGTVALSGMATSLNGLRRRLGK